MWADYLFLFYHYCIFIRVQLFISFSLLWGNLFVYYTLSGENVITSTLRRKLYIVLCSAAVIGTLMFFVLRKVDEERPPEITEENDREEIEEIDEHNADDTTELTTSTLYVN